MIPLRLVAALALALVGAGCAYRNAMWSAERHAGEARRLEQRGQPSEARAEWTQAAAKARAVVTRHPRGPVADDALVLEAEALAHSGACQDAVEPIARVRESVTDGDDRERVDLAAAECALAAGRADEADAALGELLESKNAARRSRAEYWAGAAASLRLDWSAALLHFNRSHEPSARGRGLVAEQRVRIVQAGKRSDLTPVAVELARLLRVEHGTDEATHLLELLNQFTAASETPAGRFHAAELARDSLEANGLASQMFLAAAANDTASLYAPKALIAALLLRPEILDSVVGVLNTRYPTSPYTRAFHGEPSPAFTAAEDSLARELGLAATRRQVVPAALLFDPPSPGPRGPRPLP
jgi:hypothetical protein